MEDIFNKELIAFQIPDPEGKTYNQSLLFQSEDEVKKFFNNPAKVLDVLRLEMDEEHETLDSFMEIFTGGKDAMQINEVCIILQYCGKMWIKRINKGFIIKH